MKTKNAEARGGNNRAEMHQKLYEWPQPRPRILCKKTKQRVPENSQENSQETLTIRGHGDSMEVVVMELESPLITQTLASMMATHFLSTEHSFKMSNAK